jgi:hypothetical protein
VKLPTVQEMKLKYGHDAEAFAEFFSGRGEVICNPYFFRSFGESFASYLIRKESINEHRDFIKKFNEDLKSSFLEFQEWFRFISHNEPGGFLITYPRGLDNLFNDRFKLVSANKYQFKKEIDLEHLMYENFHWFDLQETVKIQRQYKKSDLFLTINGNEKYMIELKSGVAKRKDIYQALDYSKLEQGSSPILIAHSFTEDQLELAKEMGVGFYGYSIFMELPDTGIDIYPALGLQSEKFTSWMDYMVHETGHIVGHIRGTWLDRTLVDECKHHKEDAIKRSKAFAETLDKYAS